MLKPLNRAATQASKSLVRSWQIMPLSLALFAVFLIASWMFGAVPGIAGDFLMGIISLLCLVQFYTWCWRANRGEAVNFRSALGLADHVFSNIAFVGFILWIVFSMITPMTQGVQTPVALCLKLIVAFAFNPIAEVAILGLASQGALFTEAFRISKDHLLVWFLPIILMILISIAVIGSVPSLAEATFQFANQFNVMIPALYFLSITQSILSRIDLIQSSWSLSVLIAAPIVCWFTLFRLSLLEELE